METKPIKTIEQKLLDFQKKVTVIKKDAKNPHFKNTYASLTQILSEVKPLLSECGLILVQPINDKGIGTSIMDSEGEHQLDSFIPLPTGLNPQQMGSAITYFRRYTLASLLALEIDDDDANEASKPEVKAEAKDLPWLNKGTEAWYKVIDALTAPNSKYTVQDVETKYKLSQAIKAELLKAQEVGV